MKKLILVALMALLPSLGSAAGGGVPLDKANINLTDTESLKRGAKTFVQYCYSCHGAEFMRFNRMGADLGIDDATLQAEFMFTTDKVGELMKAAMGKKDAVEFFGTKVPDLSLVARSRGSDWLYTYLRSFYADESKPFGVNNVLFEDVAMPHVLWELQGIPNAVHNDAGKIEKLEPGLQGSMTADEYDGAVLDLVNFMTYIAEPARVDRERMGIWVLAFLVIFTFLAYLLKKEYWKDIH